jgi:RNA polymerase sigma-70 factor (ECF subfamily)
MNDDTLESHLSRIETQWTMVRQAHGQDVDLAVQARDRTFRRYQRSIYRYLWAALRRPDAADEVLQEFGLRFVSGAFRGADPLRGRFRDYVKTAVIRLVTDYRRRQGRDGAKLEDRDVASAADEISEQESLAFDENWRAEILERTWNDLLEYERTTGAPYHQALRLRAALTEASSEELAAALTQKINKQVSPEAYRKLLQRARQKFAERLLDIVAETVDGDPDALEDELVKLKLLSYCKSALDARRRS